MKNKLLFIIGLLIPIFVFFRPLFTINQIAAGDAPHFSSHELSELLQEPNVWTNRGINLGGIDSRLFLSPLLIIYGLLGNLGLTNELIVRILFYFPSLILAASGPYFLFKQLKQSTIVQYIASLLYVCNTYFILLVDGGQVGIALAYGLFPFTILSIFKLFQRNTITQFLTSLVVVQLLIIADPRIAAIAFFLYFSTISVEVIFNKFNISRLMIKRALSFIICLLGINLYWIYPLLTVSGSSLGAPSLNVQFISLLNGFTLYQPHWPYNIYGHISQPLWYFTGVFAIVCIGLVSAKSKQYVRLFIVFLLFVFLVKGENAPGGQLYNLITSIPFGSAFRDSSKFFVPILLLMGYLIGTTLSNIKWHTNIVASTVALYLLGIVMMSAHPFSFVLSGNTYNESIKHINSRLSETEGFSRSLWFPERIPDTYEVVEHPALDAKTLTDIRPLANLNVGSSDKFNYIFSDSFTKWYQILGINYLILPGDVRNPNMDEEERETWSKLIDRMSEIPSLQKKDWVSDIPVYKVSDRLPRLYGISSMPFVVGSLLPGEKQYQPALYFEDGKLDPINLFGIDPKAGTIVFNATDEDDLTMTFLQRHYMYPNQANENSWSIYSPNDYLLWKYQLLLRSIETTTFDYGHDIALSSNSNESISFSFKAPLETDYIIALRVMNSDNSDTFFSINGAEYTNHFDCPEEQLIETESGDHCRTTFSWITQGVKLSKGDNELVITNKSGVTVLNSVAFISNSDWNEAQKTAGIFMNHFGVTSVEDLPAYDINSYETIETESTTPWRMTIEAIPENVKWLVYSDGYHPEWQLQRGIEYTNSVPVYSTVNGFYVDKKWKKVHIVFRGQETFRWGVLGSVISVLIISIVALWKLPDKNEK